MKREILFRGKRVDTQKWHEGFLVEWESIGVKQTRIFVNNTSASIPVIPETVGQYVDIYEGEKDFEDDLFKRDGCSNIEQLWYDTENHMWYIGESIYGYHRNEYIKIGNSHDNNK